MLLLQNLLYFYKFKFLKYHGEINIFKKVRLISNKYLIDVGEGHLLNVLEFGNPGGFPVVFLHGGPGSGFHSSQSELFDSKQVRIIFFDQRGAGLSEPRRELRFNTTKKLINDMEIIRAHFKINKWLIVGGSWGSTLALAYSQKYPQNVSGLILRSVFLGTSKEIEWAFIDAAKKFYPDLWETFLGLLPENEQGSPIESYGKRLENEDPNIHVPAAVAWASYEGCLSRINSGIPVFPNKLDINSLSDVKNGPNTPYFEWHYIKNNFFLEKDQLITKSKKLIGIPAIIIQGRYDLLCPPITSFKLVQNWAQAEIRVIPASSHLITDPGIKNAVKTAIKDLIKKIANDC